MTARRAFLAALAVAIALGAAARFTGFASLGLTHWDEGTYVAWPQDLGSYGRGEPLAVYAPPFYPLLAGAALAVTGGDPRAAIAVAALMGLVCIAAAGLLARRWFGEAAGAAAALFVALDPLQVAYGRMALTETTFTAMALLSLVFVSRAFAGGSPRRDGLLSGVFAGLAMATKYHGPFPLAAAALVAAIALALAFARRVRPLPARELTALSWAAPPVVAIGIGLLAFVHRDMGLDAFVETRRTWVEGFHAHTVAAWLRVAADTVLEFGSPLLPPAAAAGALVLALRRDLRGRTDAWLAVAAPFVLAAVLVSYRNYTRLLVPLFALLAPLAGLAVAAAASAVARAFRRPAAAAVLASSGAAALVLLAAAGNLSDALAPRGSGYQNAAPEIARLTAGDDLMMVAQHAIYPYLGRKAAARAFTTSEPRADEVLGKLAAGGIPWLLADQDPGRHAMAAPFVAQVRLVEVAAFDNPMPWPIVYDRLGRERYRSVRERPDDLAFRSETRLILYRVER